MDPTKMLQKQMNKLWAIAWMYDNTYRLATTPTINYCIIVNHCIIINILYVGSPYSPPVCKRMQWRNPGHLSGSPIRKEGTLFFSF